MYLSSLCVDRVKRVKNFSGDDISATSTCADSSGVRNWAVGSSIGRLGVQLKLYLYDKGRR